MDVHTFLYVKINILQFSIFISVVEITHSNIIGIVYIKADMVIKSMY